MAVVTHTFEPKGANALLFGMRSDEILMSGPAGTGKSRACLEKVNALAVKYPGMRALVARKTAASLGGTALVTWREYVVRELVEAGQVTFYGGSAQEPPQYRYANGSVVVVAGLDKPTKIMSSEYDVVYVQEATELFESDWEFLITRLRNGRMPYQQLIADANPNVPHHWLKVRCDKGTTRIVETRHIDNPQLYQGGEPTERGRDYLSKLDRLTGVRRLRLRDGLWAAAEGLCFEEWDPAVHLIDRRWPPQSWTRWWAVDFGFTNPMVIQCWAEDPDGRLYLYRELYRTKHTVDLNAAEILKHVTDKDGNWTEPKPRAIICDHDAEGRDQLRKALGIPTTAANKKVQAGIQAVSRRLRVAEDGKPRLFIMRDCRLSVDPELSDAKKPTCTAEEIVGYVWDQTPGRQPKEVPIKEDDHGCDALRYLVAHRDLKSRSGVRMIR